MRRPCEVESIVEDFQTRAVEPDGAAHGAARVRLGERVVENFARGAAQLGEFVQGSEGRSRQTRVSRHTALIDRDQGAQLAEA